MGQPPKDKRPEDSPDDFELRPLQRMHADPDEPLAEPEVPQEVPAGMVACASCMLHKPESEVTLMPDGRLLCATCIVAHKRRNAREESRMAAANVTSAWFNLEDRTAWALTFAIPVVGWLVLLLVMILVRRTTTIGTPSAAYDATLLSSVILGETVLILVSLGITAMIFHGLDLPSIPNRLWKLFFLLLLDTTIFVWTGTLWNATPCLTIGYFVAARPIFLGLGIVVLLGLETLEGAITIMIAWAVVCLALLSGIARGILIPGGF